MAIREIRAIRSFFPPRSGHPKNPVNPAHPEILSKKNSGAAPENPENRVSRLFQPPRRGGGVTEPCPLAA
jgi:hypothetical protein